MPDAGKGLFELEAGRVTRDGARESRTYRMDLSASSVGILELTPSQPGAAAPRLDPVRCRSAVTLEQAPGRWMFATLEPGVCTLRVVSARVGVPLGGYRLSSRIAAANGVALGEIVANSGEDDEVIEVEPDIFQLPLDEFPGARRSVELFRAAGREGPYTLRIVGLPR